MANYSLEEMARQTNNGKRNNPSLEEMAERAGINSQTQDEGVLSNVWKGFKSGGAGVYGGIADIAHLDSAGNYLNDVVKSNQRSKDYDSVFSLDYWLNPSGAAYDAGNTIGSMAALAPAAFLLPESVAAGGATAITGLLGRLGARQLVNTAARKAATEAAAKTFIRGAATSVPESLSEGGNVRREAMEQGLSDADARAWKTAAMNLPTLALSNGLEYMLLGGKAFHPSAKAGESIAQRAVKAPFRVAPAIGANAVQNAGEELIQQTISDAQTDQPWGNPLNPAAWTPSQRQAFEVGGAMGGLLGGAANGPRAMMVNNDPLQNQDLEAAKAILNQQNQVQAQPAQTPIDSEPTAQPAMSVQEAQSRMSQPAPTISAENSLDGFDNRYVSKWESQPGATDLAGVQQSVKNRFNAMMAEYGDSVTLTGGAETGGYHEGGEYGHEGGWKLDVDINSVKDKEKFLALCKKYGFAVGDESDKGHYDLSGHRNGGVGGKQIVTPDSFISDGGQAAPSIANMTKEQFFAAVAGQESGGNYNAQNGRTGAFGKYQIMPDNWAPWAKEAGLPEGAEQTPENQEIVAKFKLGQYFDQFGPEGALVAWYSGPANAERWANGENTDVWGRSWDAKNGNGDEPSIREYVQQALGRVGATPNSSNIPDVEIPNTKTDTEEDHTFDEYNKQLDELAQNGIEEPFKTEQPTQKELVQQAKDAAIDAGDMGEVQRINSAERSGNTEELAKIADKALKAKQKEAKGKPAPATPKIKMATPNLIKQVKQLLNTAKEQGVKLDDLRIENTLKDGSEETLQNFATMLQGRINESGYESRVAQGKQLLDYADEKQIDLQPGLRKMLREGQPKAIEAGQAIIDKAMVERRNQKKATVSASQDNKITSAPQQNTAVLSKLSDEVIGTIKQYPDLRHFPINLLTPEEQEIVKEAGLVHDNPETDDDLPWVWSEPILQEGDRRFEEMRKKRAESKNASQPVQVQPAQNEQAPAQETKRAETTPAAETALADEDYHGFFDDKKPGAVREAKKRLEEKINPFGNAEGFRTVKSIMERWAEADESNQSNTKGRSYYVHGNKVSKAAYDYYNHLRKNADEEVKAKSAPKQESTKEQAAPAVITEGNYSELKKHEREHWENIAKNATPAMMKMYGEDAVERAEKEGVKLDEKLAEDAKSGNPEAIAYVSQLVWEHSMKNFDKLPKVEPKSKEVDPAKAYDNLKQLYKDITHKKQLGSDWGSYALRKAVEQGYTLSEDKNAIVSPEGKRYELSGKAIEEFRLRQRDAEDNERANVDKSGDKSNESQESANNELSQQDNGGKIEVETEESPKQENKLQRMRRGREELEAVAKKYEDGEITQSEAYSQVSKIAKEIATVPKEGVPNATFIDGKMKQELNDYGDRLIDEAFEAAEKSAASKSKFKEISDILSKYEKGEKNLIPIEDLMKQVHSLKTLSKEQMQALDERAAKIAEKDSKEVVENEQQGESGSPAGGHSGVRAGESGADEREGTGEVSERNGREGSAVHEDTGREDSERPATVGVREGTELEETTGSGTDKRGNQPTVPLTEAEAHPSPTEIPGNDYEIKDTDQSTKSEKVRFKQNVDAIKMLKQLEEDDRMPTPAEQEILGAYNGWGGLKNAFLDGNEMNKELRDLLTDAEYKAAQSTINDAFYTPPKIIRAIWEGVSHLGFKGGRVLDPSMGVGNFFGTMPRDMMDKSALRGVELDNLTSRFAKMLYPSAFVENKGFQKASVADNYFDLAISNIPFGQNMINGYQVHNYFFANGIDKVRPGGLMVYITSQGSLAGGKDAAKMRNYLENQADLIAAYKLPAGVFSDAGTQVATDIVIFRKRDKDGKKSPYGQKFGDVKEVKVGQGYYAPSYGINEYFVTHKENILGEQSTGRDQWGNMALNVKMAEGTTVADVANDLSKAMQKLPDDVYQPVSRKKSKSFDTASAQKKAAADEKTRDYEYYYKDGKPVQNQNGQEVALTGKKAKVVDDYLKVKNTLNALFAAESDPKAKAKDVEGLRKKLNKDYDSFVAKHGLLTGTAAKNYADDPSAGMVQALERPVKGGKKGEVEKADIFTTRSIKAVQEVSHVETADDALIASLTNHGTVDLDYMAKLMNSKPETIVSKLKGKLFKNPTTGEYETRDEYLSGNVREKLAQAKEAAKSDKSYADNVKELEKVIPEDLVSDEIFVNLGTPWIPVQDVQAFVDTIADSVHVSFSRGAALWTVTGWGRSAKYKLKGIDFPALLSHVLNNKAIQIYDGSGDNKVFNQEKTDAANVAAEELQQDFKDWIWKDKDREKRLVKYYNDNYNNTVVRQYDGQHLNLHAYGMNAKIELKPHQKDVVWRMLQGGNTLIAHCVGAGKTFEMQAAGMEMRRLGIANKPMYCLPNNVVQQFAREFRQLYPNAKLLVLQSNDLPAVEKTSRVEKTEDGRTKRVNLLEGKSEEQKAAIMAKRTARNRMLNRIRTEDWDGIIISHNLFQRFPVNPETAAEFIQQEIDTLEQTIREAKQDRMDSRALSNLETSKKNLQERLEEIISTDIEDIGVPFEELGIDQLFVDEADMFKNLAFATRLGNIRGLSNSKANRSQDMFLKTQWLTNNMGGRGVVFATGTPVSNTMSELYTMMRYLDMKGLKEKGLEVFDNWMRTFGDIGQGIERKPTGDGFRKVTMIKRFINMAELTKMFRKFADVKVQDELNLDIPKLKNDKTTVVALEPDEKVANYIKNVVPERVKKMKNGFKKEKGEDNMLSLTNDLRKLSLTDSKIEACAEAIAKKYHDTTDVKGTQLVFCDMGIPKAESEKASGEGTATTFDVESPEVYRTLIAKLKEKGIPDKDIAFIQNYNTKTKRDEVFQKVNNGEVRILIGSTETMGAGTNCQTHLVALHDLDAPWRPRDLEQRHGRILRQGNENKEVEIFNYVVKDSFDANMWEKLKNKAAIIQQAMSGDMNLRTVEDSDLVTLSYAEVEGAATGNPLIKEQLQVQNDLTKYQHAQTAFRKKVRDAENTLAGSEESIAEQEKVIAKIEKDIAQRKDTKGDKFSMLINGKGYKDRTKADEALANILKNYKQQKPMDIGQIGGFRLTALYKPEGEILLQLVNNRAYTVQTNSVAGIENTLRNNPDKNLENRQKNLNEYKEQVAQAQEIVQQENPYAEKVKQLSDRLNQLNREIADTLVDDGKQKVAQAEDTAVDSEPETEVKEPAKEEKPAVKENLTTEQKAKFSMTGEMKRALNNAKVVDESDYTSQERKVAEFGKTIGTPIVWIEAAPKMHGFHVFTDMVIDGKVIPAGSTVLNRRSNMPLPQVFWHETFHWIANNEDNKNFYDEVMDYFKGKISKAQMDAFVKRNGRTDLTTDEDIIEEMLADAFEDVSQRVEIFKEMGVEQPSLARKFVAWVKRIMDKFAEFFHNPEGKLTTAQRDSFVKAFGRLARDMKDGNGRPLFKVYNDGKEIRLPSGELATASIKLSAGKANNNGETKYSYGPSNNSNKGFLNCIRNVFSKDELAPGEEWRTRKRLTEMLEKALQVKIKPGDVSKGVYPLDGFGHGKVIFKESDKVIKSQNAYDFENILPLSGAIIAEKLGMVDKWTKAPEETRNYIAKWIVTGAPNDTSTVAKDFAKAMQGNQILATRLEALQDEFMKWEQMSYDEKMKRLISFDNKQKIKLKDRMNRLYEEFVEELAPVDRLVKAINAKRNAMGKKDLGELADPYVAFRLLRGSYGNTITMIEGIGDDAVKALREKFPNLKWENFKTMRDILESIGGYQNTEVQKDFVTYCIAHHVLDMHNRNDEIENSKAELMQKKQTLLDEIDDYTKRKKKLEASHWLSESERAEVKLLDKNIEGNKKRVAELEDKLEKLKLLKTPKEYSRENCERYIKDYDKKYGDKFRIAQQDMVNFSNTTAEMLYDSGVIGYKRYQELMSSWPNYVPMFRVFDENEDIDFGDSMEHIEGSTRDIVNPLESIIRNTALFVKKAETNKARQLLANIARCDSSAYLLEEKDAKDNEEKTITFYENGQKKYLVTDPDIVRAVNNFMLPGNTSAWVQLFHSITSIARAAFTTVNPEFFLRNPVRDIADAMLYTKYGYTISLKDFVNGLMHAIRRDDVYYEWLTQGAGQASVVALDRDYTKSILEKMSRTTKEQFRKNFLSALVDSVQKLSEYSELGTRIATYKHAKRAVLKDKPNATIEEVHEAMVAAALESRDLMDFARHGKAGAEWNKYVAFSNASIQGLDKLYRQIRNPKTRGKTMAKLAIYAVLPALVLFMLNKDDDEYKQAESWLKETHWLIPMGDTFLRIPKAADVGVRFLSNWVEKNLEAAYYGKEHEWTEYAKPLYDALPDITWTALAPMLEMKHNYDDFTQRNIVPQKEQHLPAYLQYGERQTRASKWLGEMLYKIAPEDMKKYTSPRMIEHFVVGYFGTMGMMPFKAWDLISGEKSQSLSIEELPVIRGFLWKAYKSPESVNDFYKEYNKQLTFENEFKMTHQKPEEFDPAKLKRLKQAQKMMQKIKKQEKTIIDSDKWSIEDKEVMQRNIQKKRIEIAKRALGQK